MTLEYLTQGEKDKLAKSCWRYCQASYSNAIIKARLFSEYETQSELEFEAQELMNHLLSRFDRSKCKEVNLDTSLKSSFQDYFDERVHTITGNAKNYKNLKEDL